MEGGIPYRHSPRTIPCHSKYFNVRWFMVVPNTAMHFIPNKYYLFIQKRSLVLLRLFKEWFKDATICFTSYFYLSVWLELVGRGCGGCCCCFFSLWCFLFFVFGCFWNLCFCLSEILISRFCLVCFGTRGFCFYLGFQIAWDLLLNDSNFYE